MYLKHLSDNSLIEATENLVRKERENLAQSFFKKEAHTKEEKLGLLTQLEKFNINNELKSKLDKVKGLYAHTNSNMTMAELLNLLCDMAIDHKTATFRKRCVTKYKKNQCENCHSTYALEIDHIIPRAKGGTDDPENLRTLCRSCNQRAAIKEFGLKKMAAYIDH